MDIGAWIRAARDARGWKQAELADKLGTSKANLSHWETGKHEPSFGQLLRIRDLTGHPLREVEPDAAWPLPEIPRERITSLEPEELMALQASLVAALTMIAPRASSEKPRRTGHGMSNVLTMPARRPPRIHSRSYGSRGWVIDLHMRWALCQVAGSWMPAACGNGCEAANDAREKPHDALANPADAAPQQCGTLAPVLVPGEIPCNT